MSTALQIAQAACTLTDLDQTLTSFTSPSEFPYNTVLTAMNTAIAELNRAGFYWWSEASVTIPYAVSTNAYTLSSLTSYQIDPRRIIRIWRALVGSTGNLTPYVFKTFQQYFQVNTTPTQQPTAWAVYGDTLYLNTFPDQNYNLTMYYYNQIQQITVGVNDGLPTIVPPDHEDVLRDMVLAHIKIIKGDSDAAALYTVMQQKVKNLVAQSGRSTAIPTQMPGVMSSGSNW